MSTVTGQEGGTSATASTPTPGDSRPPRHRRGPRQHKSDAGGHTNEVNQAGPSVNERIRQRRRRPPQDRDARQPRPSGSQSHPEGKELGSIADGVQEGEKKRRPPQHSQQPPRDRTQQDGSKPKKGSRRAARFGAGLTEDKGGGGPSHSVEHTRQSYALPEKDDLTSTLIRELSTRPYPDCLICFSAIRPQEPTFSCSPTIPIVGEDEDGKVGSGMHPPAQCCWTTFHLKCIKAWASKSVKETEAAWKARGVDRLGVWRCPGCQSQRNVVPSVYRCFCGAVVEPRPPRLATPHSCASQCTRARACSHSCPLTCHPGPCPPCQVTTQKLCFCGKKTLSFRCGNLVQHRATALSCGQPCGRLLDCGNHQCETMCHDGPCAPCQITATWKCYCGKEERVLKCGEGEARVSVINEGGLERTWVGRFECENECNRPFDCGIHRCTKRCHVPSPTPAPCPRSPSLIHTCPCGRHALDPSSASFFPPNTKLERTSCTDPIPTCNSICSKNLDGCSHLCASKCHIGPCPPCTVKLIRPCRCSSSTHEIPCFEDQARSRGELEGEILCDKPCTALRACGRHQCNRICCPLASLSSSSKGKGKKKAHAQMMDQDAGVIDEAGWHVCDIICGKLLSCGNHNCEEPDHRGPCPPCLRSSFEEMVCACGRTVLEPPIPCGTKMDCPYPCTRPPPACGHPKMPHKCHEDDVGCPPCPVLTSKLCACGKKMVGNVRCSSEKVFCGTPCGKLLACGFHHCERTCHGDNCGDCHATCGKPRKLCLPANHPCTLPCHAPTSCPEDEPCRATINISCPCGRIRQPVSCGRSTANPAGREGSQPLKCTNECAIAKRNARLAEALGINTSGADSKAAAVTYSDELIGFARTNMKFCLLVEKTLNEFVSSDRRSQVLPHMPEQRRNFVHNLASVYRMDTQMVDQEPHRSVQLIRRIDTRIPSPLLSSAATTSTSIVPAVSLGKLTPLRAPIAQRATNALPSTFTRPVSSASSSGTPTGSSTQSQARRGWTAVVAGPTSSNPSPAPSPSAWLTESKRPVATDSAMVTPSGRTPQSLSKPVTPAAVAPEVATNEVPDNWEDDA